MLGTKDSLMGSLCCCQSLNFPEEGSLVWKWVLTVSLFDVILQDNRVNGVCSASRLVGVYHLWPQIIPIPSTESVELRNEDEHIVIATNSLWKHVTYDQTVHEVKSISDPIQAAKRLRDLAVAHGCSMDISVTVIKLKIDRDPSVRSSTNLQPLLRPYMQTTDPREEEEGADEGAQQEDEEEEEEDPGITNIDDSMSEEEEEERRDILLPLDSSAATQESMDQLVLGAIGTELAGGPNTDQPSMQSTNFDDLPLTDESPGTPTPAGTDSTPSDLPHRVAASGHQQAPQRGGYGVKQQLQQMEMDYEAQTIPKQSQARRSAGFTDLVTSFEQTQVCV